MTMPRMELVAATLSVKISVLLKKELQIPIKKEMFWTDSEVVLAYIRNEAKRFKIFVANRTELIKEHSDECQWFYISSKQNPADHAPGGIDTCNQNKVKEWLLGPVSLEAKRKLELEQNLYSCQFSSYRTEERFSC